MTTETMKAVGQYDEFNARMAEAKNYSNFIPDDETKEGYEKSKRVSLDLGIILTALEKSRVDKKADSLAIGRAIDSEAKGIKATLEEMQEPHKLAYKKIDNAKKAREKARVDELSERVQSMRELPESLREADSDSIAGALEAMNADECLDFYEFSAEALKARNYARTELAKMFQDALQAEADAAELAELRAAQAEQAIKDREQAAADKVREDAEKEKVATRLESDHEIALLTNNQMIAHKSIADAREAAEEATRQSEASRIAEAEKAEDERIKAEQKAEADKQAAIEAERQRQADEEMAEKQAAEAREADVANKRLVNNLAKQCFIDGGMTEECAQLAVKLIAQKVITSVSIAY